jgi:hypothetical protein
LLVADVFLSLLLAVSLRPLLAVIQRRRSARELAVGVWLMALGYALGCAVSGFTPHVVGVLATELFPPVLFVALVARFEREGGLSFLPAKLFVAVGVGVALLALAEGGARATATFENPNYTGHFLAVALVPLLLLPWRRNVRIAIAIVMCMGILASGSFGAISAIGAAVGYRALCIGRRLGRRQRSAVRIIVALAVVFGSWFVAQHADPSILAESSPGLSEARFERSSSSRTEIWQATIELWEKHPTGIGFAESVDHRPLQSYLIAGEPHNNFLSALLNGGVIALAGMVATMWAVWRMLPRASASRMLFVAFVASGLTRETWNFRHFWLGLCVTVFLERAVLARALAEGRSSG